MKYANKTKEQLIDELNEIQQKFAEYRKNTEEALQAREERYQRIIETVNEGILILDAQDNTTFVNTKMCEMLGYESEEMIGKSVFNFVDEGKWLLIQSSLERHHQGIHEQYDCTFKFKNGNDLLVIVNAAPIYDTKGRYEGSFAVITDITQDKQIESELSRYQQHLKELIESRTEELTKVNQELQNEITNRKQAEAALIQSEEKFSKAFHCNGDLMAISTLREGRYVEVNDAFVEITGYNRQELIGRTSQELGLWAIPEERNNLLKQIQKHGSIRGFELDIRMKSSEIRTFCLSGEIVDINHEAHLINTSRDITEKKRMEEALRLSEECLSKAFNASPVLMTITTLEEGEFIKANNAFWWGCYNKNVYKEGASCISDSGSRSRDRP